MSVDCPIYVYLENCTKLYKFEYNDIDDKYSLYYYIKFYGKYHPTNKSKAFVKKYDSLEIDSVLNYIKINKKLPPE